MNLPENQENLRTLVSAVPAAIFACDRDGVITYYNRRAVEILGREPTVHDPAWFFLGACGLRRPDGTPLSPEGLPVREVLDSGLSIMNREFVLDHPDSSGVYLLASIAPLRDSSASSVGAVTVFQDFTELKRAQQERERMIRELEQANRELSQFSYTVSHDLQAPVRRVRALSQLLSSEGLPEHASHLVGLIEQASGSMQRLIESLLWYAQAGHRRLSLQVIHVDEVIESVRATLAALITQTEARIIVQALPAVDADRVQLEQLFQNLLTNAIKYRRPKTAPVIEIVCEPAESEWRFSIKDNGRGIPREYQGDVFEPLKRLQGDDAEGTGLGLAICRTIVSRHGGRIWVESEGADSGAAFHFTLPAHHPSASAPDNAMA